MPVWPGSPGFRLIQTLSLARGDVANNSRLESDIHVGTHVDAPWHFLQDGATVERAPLDTLVGPAVVAYLPEARAVTAAALEGLELGETPQRLLLRTSNSELWRRGVREFREDFVALTVDAARWLVHRGVRLVGVDYLSVQRFHDGPETHEVLLRAGVVIVEGLDLSAVTPGRYELLCLPLKIVGAEGAPARAALRRLSP
jgi:arylformamidase